jgi:hypothetical protein
VIIPGTGSWQLRDCEQIIIGNAGLLGQKHFLIGITRLRNEALILRDTLNYVGKHADAIIAYDDASTGSTSRTFAADCSRTDAVRLDILL